MLSSDRADVDRFHRPWRVNFETADAAGYFWDGAMDLQGLIDGFRENPAIWMLVMFVGILYWAFRPRFRRRPKSDDGGAAKADD